jgi:3-phenylpropionate/trans-cinnamate dioxygenase ferredoxin subunit
MFNYRPYDESQCDFYEIAPLAELPNGERLFVELDDLPIVIFNIADYFYAIRDRCSHEDLEIGDGEVDGYELICPHHGARFDLRTGEALTLPAVEDIPVYPVRVREGMIELGIPKEA